MSSSLTEIAKSFELPIEYMALLKKKGHIGDWIQDDEIAWFVLLKATWADPDFIKIQIKGMTAKVRANIMKEAKPKPVDAFILKVFKNKKPGQKISTSDLMIEVRQKFGLAMNDGLRARIGKLKIMAANTKRKPIK